MNFSEFSSDPPAKIARLATDVEEIEETYQAVGFDINCRQTQGGSFNCKTATAMIGEIGAIWQRCDKSVFIQAEAPPGHVHFTIPISFGDSGKFMGESYTDRELLIYQPGAELDLSGSELTGGDVLVLPQNRFHEIAEALFPETISLERSATRMIQRDRESIYRVRRLVQNLIADPTTHQDTEHTSAVIAEIISWVADSGDHRAGERLIGNQARGLIARRIRDVLENKYRHPIPMEQICRELGVSLRTLNRSFSEYFDSTPTHYLKILRLDRARRDMMAGDPSVDSVTEIAMNSGYAHLGRFSVEYRAHFGESPNEVLNR
jgi:AraC-like DNA-binding protein